MLCCIRREFTYESPGERILKIGPHLPKLLANIKQLTWYIMVKTGRRCIIVNNAVIVVFRLIIISLLYPLHLSD